MSNVWYFIPNLNRYFFFRGWNRKSNLVFEKLVSSLMWLEFAISFNETLTICLNCGYEETRSEPNETSKGLFKKNVGYPKMVTNGDIEGRGVCSNDDVTTVFFNINISHFLLFSSHPLKLELNTYFIKWSHYNVVHFN